MHTHSHTVVSVSVCVCACVVGTQASSAKTDELIETSFEAWLTWAQGTMYKIGLDIPHEIGQLRGLSDPLKSIGSLCGGVCSESNHSMLNNSTTVRLLHPTAMIATGQCYIKLSLWKICPLQCGFLKKTFLDHLFEVISGIMRLHQSKGGGALWRLVDLKLILLQKSINIINDNDNVTIDYAI